MIQKHRRDEIVGCTLRNAVSNEGRDVGRRHQMHDPEQQKQQPASSKQSDASRCGHLQSFAKYRSHNLNAIVIEGPVSLSFLHLDLIEMLESLRRSWWRAFLPQHKGKTVHHRLWKSDMA